MIETTNNNLGFGLGNTHSPNQEDKQLGKKSKVPLYLLFLLIILIVVAIIAGKVYGLDQNQLCSALNLTFTDCNEFWAYLTNSSVVTTQINITFYNTTIINNTYHYNNTINNTLLPEKSIEQLQLEFTHAERIACIELAGCDLSALTSYQNPNSTKATGLSSLDELIYSKPPINQQQTANNVNQNSPANWSVFWIFLIGVVVIIVVWRMISSIKKGAGNTPDPDVQKIKAALQEIVADGSNREIETKQDRYNKIEKKKVPKRKVENYDDESVG